MRDCSVESHERFNKPAEAREAGPVLGFQREMAMTLTSKQGCWPCAWLPILLGVLAVAFSVSVVEAASPRINRLQPQGAQLGTNVELTIHGNRLDDAAGLFLYEPGIRVEEIIATAGDRLVCRVKIAEDCPLGEHGLRVRTNSGISNLATFRVGPFAEIEEREPNNDFAAPQAIPLNVTVNGVVENEDVDYFAVDMTAGQRLNVEVEGVRLGMTFFDPSVAIYNTQRFVLAASDDSPLVQQDAVCGVSIPEDGTYIVQVRESAFGGSNQSRYRLHVGTFPRPTAVFPPGGKPGETLLLRWLGDTGGVWEEEITLPATPSRETIGLFARSQGLPAPSPNWVRVNELDNVTESEPNDALNQGIPGEVPVAFCGIVEKPGDVDHFSFTAKKGQQYDIRVFARALRSPLDSVLSVHKPDGAAVGSNDDTGSPDSYYRLRADSDGQYSVRIRDHLLRGGEDFVYRIEVAPVRPKLAMSLPERRQFEDVTATVPRGNRFAFLIGAVREDFGGPVEPVFEGLPPGVSAELITIPDGSPNAVALLSAAEDAPLEGRLARLEGRATVGEREIIGQLSQRTSLVRGQNNREIWNYEQDRMAIAVGEVVPCQVEIVQPKVPIVQGGAMELKITASREEGFDGPVTVQMLALPRGVSSPASVTLEAGQSETRMPLTATDNAAVGTARIAALGQLDTGNGPALIATQLATLEVASPMVAFAYPQAAVEQGKELPLPIGVTVNTAFDGPAQVELLGLPAGVSTSPQEITAESTQCVFPLRVSEDAPVGLHKSLVCRVTVMRDGEPIVHMLRGGELRVQKPLPPPKEPEPEAGAAPEPEPEPPKEKPLSRLEQLRQRKEQNSQGSP